MLPIKHSWSCKLLQWSWRHKFFAHAHCHNCSTASESVMVTWQCVQLELATGQVRDTYCIPNDFIHLANNSGANLYDDLLAICAVRLSLAATCPQSDPLPFSLHGVCPCQHMCDAAPCPYKPCRHAVGCQVPCVLPMLPGATRACWKHLCQTACCHPCSTVDIK